MGRALLLFFFGLISAFGLKIENEKKQSQYGNCVFDLTDSNGLDVSYNLTAFNLANNAFAVYDTSTSQNEYWLYKWDICNSLSQTVMDTEPSLCKTGNLGPCLEWNETSGHCLSKYNSTNLSPNALRMTAQSNQVSESSGLEGTGHNFTECIWLGLDTPNVVNYSVSLYDDSDSARGVVYSMQNGGQCSSDASQNFGLIIELICPDSKNDYLSAKQSIMITTQSVEEGPDCVYTLTYKTPLACPKECLDFHTDDDDVFICGGKGVCATDPIAGKVTCLCDDGYAGDKCDESYENTVTIQKSFSGIKAAAVTMTVILVIGFAILVGLGYFYFVKCKIMNAGVHYQRQEA